ncbi:hypothetical protein FS837_012878 [Tulasnella sp. UAMH 9824]|nr:hypothetical protein FS837_012878 [Tulasnella sp. UAMH 9824]
MLEDLSHAVVSQLSSYNDVGMCLGSETRNPYKALTAKLVVSGQLHFEVPNGHTHHSRHFDCLSKEQKKAIRWKHKNATDLSGYASLKPQDKARVRESIGLNEEGQGTSGVQNRVDEKTESKGKGKEKAPHHDFQENVPESSSQHTENRPRSPEHFQWWHDNMPSWDDPESPQSPQEAVSSSRGKETSNLNKQYRWGNTQSETRAQRVPQPAGAFHQANGPSISEQSSRAPQDSEESILSAPTEPTSVPDLPVANLGPPAAPKPEVDANVLMKLELEDKEAEARLAEAELMLAETRVKVETARRAVVAQKLKMAKAGLPPPN